jgi:ABC-2 type transport system permease protein
MRLLRHQLRWEQRLFWRSRESAVFVFLFPILLFTLLTAVYNGHTYGHPASWALLAGMIGYGAANTAFAGLAITVVSRREIGILKRIRATPLPPAVYLAAVLLSIMTVFALQVASLFVLGRLLKSTPWPGHHRVHPLARGLVGGPERDRAANGVPHRIFRPDPPLSEGAPRNR